MNDLLLALAASATASALLGLHGLARRQTARWPWWARDLACLRDPAPARIVCNAAARRPENAPRGSGQGMPAGACAR